MTPASRIVTAVVIATATVGACYREASAPLGNQAEPAARALATCGRTDDVEHAPVDMSPDGRLRSHIEGSLAGRSGRSWTGPDVPDHIPRQVGTLELFVLDDADGGLLALYREPYELGSCQLGDGTNCAYEVRFYDRAKRMAWALRLNDVLSRPDRLEVQDLRLASGVLYFNEACQGYASEAGGRCSSLVAVDPRGPRGPRVLWRTPSLVSNGRFVVRGCYLIAGYGFTAEPDTVSVVDRATGKLVQRIGVSSAPQRYALVTPDRLQVELYSGITRRYRLEGFDGGPAAMISLDPPEPGYGGAGYGGAGYGGMGYGGMGYGGMGYGGYPPPPPPRPRHP